MDTNTNMLTVKAQKNQHNIVLDFTANKQMENLLAGQPVALMPADLAKKLLQMYAKNLRAAEPSEIIFNHITALQACGERNDLQGAMAASTSFLLERELIENVVNEQWDVYNVEEKPL